MSLSSAARSAQAVRGDRCRFEHDEQTCFPCCPRQTNGGRSCSVKEKSIESFNALDLLIRLSLGNDASFRQLCSADRAAARESVRSFWASYVPAQRSLEYTNRRRVQHELCRHLKWQDFLKDAGLVGLLQPALGWRRPHLAWTQRPIRYRRFPRLHANNRVRRDPGR